MIAFDSRSMAYRVGWFESVLSSPGTATILTKSSKKRINHLFYKP